MPKPEKDDALYLRRRIEAITRSIAELTKKRSDRIAAFEALTHERFPIETVEQELGVVKARATPQRRNIKGPGRQAGRGRRRASARSN